MADNSVANIFLGCGGTGIESLIRLNGLLSQDSHWRARLDTDVYYVVVDTEATEIVRFTEEISRQMQGYTPPYIEKVLLSRGYTTLPPAVVEYFVRPFEQGENSEGLEALSEHWWVDRNGTPFEAEDIDDLSLGAGQCPLASHFLTWLCLQDVEERFERLIREIKNRRGKLEEDNPLSHNNFSFVAGLAGGTGRGCWQLLAFKLRQMLREQDFAMQSAPMGIFCDQSVYRKVYEGNPSLERTMHINALTGVSELSSWMANTNRPKKSRYEYSLPCMQSPEDPDMNIIRLDLELAPRESAPLNASFLVFGDTPRTVFNDPEEAYEMIGASLYARMTQSAIKGRAINDRFEFNSLGAATFEIESEKIYEYCINKARIDTITRLCSEDRDVSTRFASQFITENDLYCGLSRDNRGEYMANPKGDFLQRVLDKLQNAFTPIRESQLAPAFKKDDLKRVLEASRQLIGSNEEEVKVAFKKQLTKTGDASKLLRKALEGLLQDTRSVGVVKQALGVLKERWTKMVEDLPSPEAMVMVEDTGTVIQKAATREYRVAGKRFNRADQAKVRNKLNEAYLYANYATVQEELSKTIKEWIRLLDRWLLNTRAMLRACDEVMSRFDHELHCISGKYQPSDPAEDLFTTEETLGSSLAEQFDTRKAYRKRVIKPLMGDALKDLTRPFSPGLNNLVLSSLLDKTFVSLDPYDVRPLADNLETEVRMSVWLENSFLVSQFSLQNVLGDLVRVWERYFNSQRGNQALMSNLTQRFEGFFGVKCKLYRNEIRLPQVDEFIAAMASSLAKTAVPCWSLARNIDEKDQNREILVFLPSDEMSRELRLRVQAEAPAGYRVNVYAKRYNPFMILAYAANGVRRKQGDTESPLEKVQSLGYWNKDAKVAQWMDLCESPAGASVFSGATDNAGVGYLDPVFVREPKLAEGRWRPWFKGDFTQDELQQNETLDAMIYALLAPAGAVKEELDAVGWTLPLVSEERNEQYRFARRALTYRRNKAQEVADTPWEPGELLCVSIWQVYDVLLGVGTTSGSKKKEGRTWRDAIMAESGEFWNRLAPKLGFQAGSDAYDEMLQDFSLVLAKRRGASKKKDKEAWARLVKRVNDLRAESEDA